VRHKAEVMEWALAQKAEGVRTGLEDNIRISRERLAKSNAELVGLGRETGAARRAPRMARGSARHPGSPPGLAPASHRTNQKEKLAGLVRRASGALLDGTAARSVPIERTCRRSTFRTRGSRMSFFSIEGFACQ